MPILSNTLMENLSDRLAKQVQLILAGIRDARVIGGGEHFDRVTTADDYDVENDFIDDTHSWDKYVSGQYIFPDITELADYVNVFNTHATNQGAPDLNRFLQTSGIDVADYFADVYYWIRGNRLSAYNVFYTTSLDPMGTLDVISSGIGTFTDGYSLSTNGTGNYTGRDDLTALNTAAVNLECYASGVGIGANGLGVNITCKKDDNTTEVKTVTFAANDPVWTSKDIGTSVNKYIDITNMAIATGSNANDKVIVKSKILRAIAL